MTETGRNRMDKIQNSFIVDYISVQTLKTIGEIGYTYTCKNFLETRKPKKICIEFIFILKAGIHD